MQKVDQRTAIHQRLQRINPTNERLNSSCQSQLQKKAPETGAKLAGLPEEVKSRVTRTVVQAQLVAGSCAPQAVLGRSRRPQNRSD